MRVSAEHGRFDAFGQIVREKTAEQAMPLYEATRTARCSLLLGDLGTGKSTLAAQLMADTLDRSISAVAFFISVKNLSLPNPLSVRDLIRSIDQYVANEILPEEGRIDL